MSDYYDYITNRGVIVPDTSTVLEDTQEEFRQLLGDDLDVSPETVQGRLIELITRCKVFCIRTAAASSNVFNLNKANGFGLDDLASLFLLSRNPATYTTTSVALSGVAGTTVPAGTRLQTTAGDIFVNTENYIIGSSQNAVFRAQEAGVVPCPVHTLTIILDAVNGLETADNTSTIVGTELESDTEFRARIKASLNVNSIAVISAIKANLEAIPGVNSTYLYDNYSDSSVSVDDITVPAHSILAVVDGGDEDAIAKVLYDKKTIGTGYIECYLMGADSHKYSYVGVDTTNSVIVWKYNGTLYYTNGTTMPSVGATIYSDTAHTVSVTTIASKTNTDFDIVTRTVLDPNYGTAYSVSFVRPDVTNIIVNITVARQDYTGSSLETDVKNAIVAWANGENDEVDGLKIGTDISPFEISAAVSNTIPEIFIRDCKIAKQGSSPAASIITMDAAEKGSILASNITVTII